MIAGALPALTVLAVVGCGLLAGLFLAFSTAIMPGLARLPTPAAPAAMQQGNRAIQNPLFLLVFLGTALICVLVAVFALVAGPDGAGWLAAGALLHVLGGFVVTMVVNVPMNDRLDAVDPESPEGGEVWARYLVRWTAWNHLRAFASTLATALLAIGLL